MMNAVRLTRMVDEQLLAALPELAELRGSKVQILALPDTVEDLPPPPRRLPVGHALGLLEGKVSLEQSEAARLLGESREERFE